MLHVEHGTRVQLDRQHSVGPVSSPGSATVLASSGTGDYNCTWSPDGTQIAYVEGFAGPGDLVMKRADGSTGPVPIDLETSAGWDGNPDWAPDARPQCEDQTINTTVDTPVEIPLLCADTGPNYEQTPVNALASRRTHERDRDPPRSPRPFLRVSPTPLTRASAARTRSRFAASTRSPSGIATAR